jgi:ankyrin repeat protein
MQVRYLNAATQILQEVGTARHVLITCGSEEIDGYAFCAGLASFHGLYDTRSNSRPPIASVIHLIMGAIFRPKGSHQLSHGICTLGALLDMYHSREASVQHDKVYALLGMSVDGTSETSLSPNYNLPWEELFGNLVRFLLHKEIRVETSPTRGHILIKGAVSVLGSIYGIRSDAGFEQTVEIIWRDVSNTDDHDWTPSSVWSFRLSATPIMEGDIICLFAGASLPTIVRVSGDYCFIVQIAPIPPTKVTVGEKEVDWPKLEEMARHLPTKNLQCVWEWATLREPLQSQEESVESMIEAPMVSGLWNSMLMSFEAGVLEAAESMFRRLMWACERFKEDALYKAIADQLFRTPDIDFRCIQQESVVDPLIWASSEGFLAVVDLLIRRDAGAVNSVGFQLDTALTSAAAMGHVEVVKRLLQEKPELNLFGLVPDRPRHGKRTALQAAAERGHFEVVEALIKDKADVNAAAAESSGRTALQAAAGGGHFAIVERLLQAGADVNAHAALEHGRTALQAAAEGGYTAIVEYLLQENAATNTPLNLYGTTALAAAVDAGSLTIVDMLLRKGADVHAKDHYGRTALHRAAYDGVLAIVERLLEAQPLVDAKDHTMRTALHIAVGKSHPEIVKRLIEAGADVNAKASSGNVLVVAKRQVDENIIVMLRQAGAVGGVLGDVISKNYYQN